MEIRLKILRIKDVLEVTNVSRTTLWRMIREGQFPKPVQISDGIRGWPEAQVWAWVKSKHEPSDDSARKPRRKAAPKVTQSVTSHTAEERPQLAEPTKPSTSSYGEMIRLKMNTGDNPSGEKLTIREVARRTRYSYEYVLNAYKGQNVSAPFDEILCELLGLDPDAMWRLAMAEKTQKQEGVGLTNLQIVPSSNETKSSGKKTPAPRKRQN